MKKTIWKLCLPTCLIGASMLAVPARAADAPPPMPSLDHFMIAISVADIAAETDWYVEKLGYKVEYNLEMGKSGIVVRWLTQGTSRIELIHTPDAKDGTPRPTPPGHIALHGIANFTLLTPDIAATRAALIARGVTPLSDVVDVPPLGVKVFFISDPEHNYIEIAQLLKK